MVTVHEIEASSERLREALDDYERFVEGWPYQSEAVPEYFERYLSDSEAVGAESEQSPGVALATEIVDRYHEAREAEGEYVEQQRSRGRSDWSRIVAETEPVRTAARRVHLAGYGADSGAGVPECVVPEEMCPASLVSMNPGSSPVTFEDRIAQYEAVAEAFDLVPGTVYHPGSGHDVSPSAAFPESRCVYVDVDEAAMAELARAGYEAVGADATGYELDAEADLTVFRNAGLLEGAVVDANLRDGGWVLANDHLDSASHLLELDALELVGVVPDTWAGDAPTVETGDPNAGPSFETHSPLDLYVFADGSSRG